MNKAKYMARYKDRFGGSYVKENGRWYWTKGKEKHLVTGGWLIHELSKPVEKPKKSVTSSKPVAETKIEEPEKVVQTQTTQQQEKKNIPTRPFSAYSRTMPKSVPQPKQPKEVVTEEIKQEETTHEQPIQE